jgi:D-alanine-D-alanine ligase-like ATP-grasp enzyme
MMQPFFFQRYTPTGLVESEEMTTSSIIILEEAHKHGVKYRSIPGTRVVELEYNGHKQYFKAQIPAQTSFIGAYITEDKAATKASLMDQGISVPPGFTILTSDPQSYWEEVFHALQKPLVVKPSNLNKGTNVFINLTTLDEYREAVTTCFSELYGKEANVVVEEMFEGKEYRITATPEKVLAILNRVPANVVGDGQHTIKQLVDQKNTDPRRSDDPNGILVKIKIDDEAIEYLAEQSLTPDSIPAPEQQVFLRKNSNISTGGDGIDVTDTAHPSVHQIALQAMKAFPGLAFGGIDFMTKNIFQPQTPDTYAIIEVNVSPGFGIHDNPYQGENRHVAREFLYILFPELRSANSTKSE